MLIVAVAGKKNRNYDYVVRRTPNISVQIKRTPCYVWDYLEPHIQYISRQN